MTNLNNKVYNSFIIPNNEKNGQYFLFKVKSIFIYYNHSIYILRFIKVENKNNSNNLSKNK